MTLRGRVGRALDQMGQVLKELREQDRRRREAEARAAEEDRRDRAILRRFESLLSEDLIIRADAALSDKHHTLWRWIEYLFDGRCRLPECLTEGVMRWLILVNLDQADKIDSYYAVCLRCGLLYPMHKSPPLSEWKLAPGCLPDERPLRYDLPHFFDHDGCPACDASSKVGSMNWAHLIEGGYWFGSVGKEQAREGVRGSNTVTERAESGANALR